MVLYTIAQTPAGPWSVRRQGLALFNDMQLAAAIRLARTVARDEHVRSHRTVRVEMRDAAHVIPLGNFDQAYGRSAAA
ncbi:MAG: hypothetical protein ABI870_09250 [Rhodanobacter sp.]